MADWLEENISLGRVILLVLLLLAYLGPWFFEQINIPEEFPCGPDYIRLEGPYCGTPASGILWLPLAGLFSGVVGLVQGESYSWRQVGVSFLFGLILLPGVSSIFLIASGSSRRQIFHLLSLVAGLGVVMYILGVLDPPGGLHRSLWGLCLFLGVTSVWLIFEWLSLALRVKKAGGA